MTYIIGEFVTVKAQGRWYDAEILDILGSYAYVYIFDLRIKKNIRLGDMR